MPPRDGPHKIPELSYRRINRKAERNKLINEINLDTAEPEEFVPSQTFSPKNIGPGLWVPGTNDQIDPTGKSNTQVG